MSPHDNLQVLLIVDGQKARRLGVFINSRETTEIFVPPIVRGIIVDATHLTDQYRAFARLPVETVIQTLVQADAFTGRQKYLAAGFNDYLTKPIIDETILLETIARWLNPES